MFETLSTTDLMYLLDAKRSTILRRAKREDWVSRPRSGRGGGSDWIITSMPMTTRRAIGIAMTSKAYRCEFDPELLAPNDTLSLPVTPRLPAVSAKCLAPVLSNTGHLTAKQRNAMIARKAILNEVDRLGMVAGMSKRNAILHLEKAWREGTLDERLRQATVTANDKTGKTKDRGLSYATVYRWSKALEEGGELALAPKHSGPDMSVPEWFPAFLTHYQRPQKPTLSNAYKDFAAEWPGKVPSIWAVGRLLKKMPLPEREAGRVTGNALLKLRPHKRRSTDEFWPTDIYTADGTTFDAEVRHPLHGQPFKPETTLFIDVATRRCVGLSVGLAESGFVILDALRMACLFGGIPAELYTDNGSGYCNQLMTAEGSGMMDRLGITMRNAIPGRPQGKGLMERAVQTICEPVSKRFATCSHADMDPDAAKKVFHITRAQGKRGESRLLPSWEEFKAAMLARIDEYNATPHRGLPRVEDQTTGRRRHLSPDEAWQGFVQRGWEPVRVSEEIRDELFMPGLTRQVRNGEVHIFNSIYYADELADFHMQSVEVRYDIWDASIVYCWTTQGKKICAATLNGNSIPYQTQSRMEASWDKREKAQIGRIGKKLSMISPGATIQLPDEQPVFTMMADSITKNVAEKVLSTSSEEKMQSEYHGDMLELSINSTKRPLFQSAMERYTWLIKNQDSWKDGDDEWLQSYILCDEYKEFQSYFAARGLAWPDVSACF